MKIRFIRLFIVALAIALVSMIIVLNFGGNPQKNAQQATALNLQAGNPQATDFNKTFMPASFKSIFEAGDMLMLSGIAEPNTTISILDTETALRQVKVGQDGRWATELSIVPDEIMELSLSMFLETGAKIVSDETAYRVPLPLIAADQIEITSPPALLLITSSGGVSRIYQSPFGAAPSSGPLILGPVDYDDLGGVIFSGSSDVPGRVRIYVDGNAIGDTRVAANGRWYYIRADTLAVGEYDIAAELTPIDSAPFRITVPFERLSPTLAKSANDSFVKFEPKRWQMRRGLRGGGGQYTVILSPDDIIPLAVPRETD